MATKVTMSYQRLQALFSAIQQLDGRDEVAKDSDGKTLGIIKKPYDFDDGGKTRYALARTRALIRKQVIDWENSITAEKKTLPTTVPMREKDEVAFQKFHDDLAAVNQLLNEMAQKEVEVEVHKVDIVKLKIDTNKLAPTLIEDLMPMLDGEL